MMRKVSLVAIQMNGTWIKLNEVRALFYEPLVEVKVGIMDWQECDWNVGSGIPCGELIKDETSRFCKRHSIMEREQREAKP